MTADDLETLTVDDVANRLGVRAETVRCWVRDGRLAAMRWGGRLRFTVQAVAEYQRSCQVRIESPAERLRQPGRARPRHVLP
jgi:excisionase family DNA binding protein